MTGTAKKIVDKILEQKSQGNKTIRITTETKLILKGIDPNQFNSSTPDDPVVLEKLRRLASELGVQL